MNVRTVDGRPFRHHPQTDRLAFSVARRRYRDGAQKRYLYALKLFLVPQNAVLKMLLSTRSCSGHIVGCFVPFVNTGVHLVGRNGRVRILKEIDV